MLVDDSDNEDESVDDIVNKSFRSHGLEYIDKHDWLENHLVASGIYPHYDTADVTETLLNMEQRDSNPDVRAAVNHFRRGLKYFVNDQPEEAVRAFKDFSSRTYIEVADILHGIALNGSGEFGSALELFDRVLEFNPTNYLALQGASFACQNLELFDAALDYAEKMIEKNESLAQGWVFKSRALGELERIDEAFEAINIALELRPDNYSSLLQKGILFYDQDNFEAALPFFDMCSNQDPTDTTIHSFRGIALMILNRHEEAENVFLDGLKINPKNSLFHDHLGDIYYGQKRLEKAIKHYQASVDIFPHDSDAHAQLATAYADFGELDTAIKALYHGIFFFPKNEQLLKLVNIALISSRRYDEALEMGELYVSAHEKGKDVAFDLAHYAFHDGEYKTCFDALKMVDKHVNDNSGATKMAGYLQKLEELQTKFVESADHEMVIDMGKTLVSIDPLNRDHAFHLAEAYFMTGQINRCFGALRALNSRYNGNDHQTVNKMSHFYLKLGKNGKAGKLKRHAKQLMAA